MDHTSDVFEPQYQQIDGMENDSILSISTHFHSALISKKGRIFTCGKSENDVLGHPQFFEQQLTRFIMIESLQDKIMTQISCGEKHTITLTSDGTIFQWGVILG